MTMRRRAMRIISARPASTSDQWWTVRTASAASTAFAQIGKCSATARTTGAAPPLRCLIMTVLGSTATTVFDGS
jgi:hypothetical protein